MKKVLCNLATSMFISTCLLFSCTEKESFSPGDAIMISDEITLLTPPPIEPYLQYTGASEVGSSERRDCMQVVWVPRNFTSIQDALDAVCPGGKVFISAGEYSADTLFVWKPGLDIRGFNEVKLNLGFGFRILEGADDF